MKVAITRVRNEAHIIEKTISRLAGHFDGVVVFDDCSTDDTVEICKRHPLVLEIIPNPEEWKSKPAERKALETDQRQFLHDYAYEKYNPEWMLYLDGDEWLYFNEDKIDWNSETVYCFALYDVYITPKDKDLPFYQRNYIGPEFRLIPMLFRPPALFYNRLPRRPHGIPFKVGGSVKHFGKGISVDHWEETCDYYINHLDEVLKTGETIAERWKKRKGKAIHELSDYGLPLIHWDERFTSEHVIELSKVEK